MTATTQGFLLGLAAALTGVLLYVCCQVGGSLLIGERGEKSSAAATVAAPAEAEAPAPAFVAAR